VRVFLTGGSGQLGRELLRSAPDDAVIDAPGRSQLSLTDHETVAKMVAATQPDLVINTAAYTDVDRAERESPQAFAVNADGARALADAASAVGARMIQVSTDFVFDGCTDRAYRPEDEATPLGAYGASKLAGEQAVAAALPEQSLVVRTSWLFSSSGRNFVTTMLRLLAERDEVPVAADQVGSPTSARNLACALWRWTTIPGASGIRHLSDKGIASWYDLAVAVREQAAAVGLLEGGAVIRPTRTRDDPAAAKRPRFSALDSSASWRETGLEAQHWRASLPHVLLDVAGHG